MPIYEYQCQNCGQYVELLQKVSDAPIKRCEACGKNTMNKLVSSPSFQLKGDGWYVTDFRDKNKQMKTVTEKNSDTTETKSATTETTKTDSTTAKTDTKVDKTVKTEKPKTTKQKSGLTLSKRLLT